MKKKTLLLSVLTIVMCLSLAVGGTFALFTSNSTVDMTVSSGKVNVTSNFVESSVQTKQLYEDAYTAGTDNMYEGEVAFSDDFKSLTLSNLVPGDAVKFQIQVNNNSTVAVKYRTIVTCDDTDGLFEALAVSIQNISANYNGNRFATNWSIMPVGSHTIDVEIALPDADDNNAYQNKSCKISYYVEAVQGNAKTENVSTGVEVNGATEDAVLKTNGADSPEVEVPVELLSDIAGDVEKVSLKHSEPVIENNTVSFAVLELVDENGDKIDLKALNNDKPITVKFSVGDAFEFGDVVLVYHDGEIVASPVVDADKNITYTTTHFCEVLVGFNDGKIDSAKEFLNTINQVKDGDVITLAGDIVFDKDNRTNNSGYWDGLAFTGDESFTIDLGGYTITQDGSLNDYLFWFKNAGSKASEITFKNGTLDAGKTAYSALATSTSNSQTITVNLENVNLINDISNGAVIKIRGGAILNLKAGTVITGKNSYSGIECANATTNVYDGVEIYQNGTSSSWGSLIGVSGGGTANIYGGYGVSKKGCFMAMTSGGTINLYGGEWIANADGSPAPVDLGNNSVLIAQSNKQYTTSIGNSIVNVYGGTFKGSYNCYGDKVGDAQINIYGGNFNVDPTTYLANGATFIEKDGAYVVGKIATNEAELKSAITNAKDGDTILIADDITVTENWDERYGGRTNKNITIDGLGNTLKFLGTVIDNNYHCVFRLEGDATVKNLTFDFSELAGTGSQVRAISAKASLTVDNCNFIGSTNYSNARAIIFGEGNGTVDESACITNCTFVNWRKGITDNENAKDFKSVVISGNTLTNASINVSAYEIVSITDNEFVNGGVEVTSYTNGANVKVVVINNVIDVNAKNEIKRNVNASNVTAQEGIAVLG